MKRVSVAQAMTLSVFALFFLTPSADAQTVEACTISNPPINCQGLWALQVDISVPRSLDAQAKDPGCAAESNEDVLRVMRASRAARVPALQEYSGPLIPAAESLLGGSLRSRGIDASRMLLPFHKDGVTCATVAVITPWPTIYMGYRLLAADDSQEAVFHPCEAGVDCPIGSSLFPVEPVIQRNSTINIIYAPFVSWSSEHGRRARLIVFYRMRLADQRPRADWTPPSKDLERHFPLEGAANFRDVGGYEAAEGKHVRRGVLFRSDALDTLTDADLEVLRKLNIARITDFRTTLEVAKRPDHLTKDLENARVHLPLSEFVSRENPEKSREIRAAAISEFMKAMESGNEETFTRLMVDHFYPALPRSGRESFKRWIHGLLEGPDDSAQVLHCTGGRDRTGVAAALLLLVLGVPKEQIVDDFLLTNQFLSSPHGVALLRGKGVAEASADFPLRAEYLEAAFKAMEEDYGSVDNYVRQGLGVDDAMKEKLRARYLE